MSPSLLSKRMIPMLALVTLTVLLGLQALRALVPYFPFLLRDRFGWDTISVGILALVVFLTSFLAGPLNRFLGSLLALLVTALAVGIGRLAVQFWNYEPLGDMIMAATAVIGFLLFLPIALGLARRSGSNAPGNFGLGFLIGVLLDMAIHGAFLSYDLSWQGGWMPALVVSLLVLAQWVALLYAMRGEFPEETADAYLQQALSWSLIGPLLFLEMLLFANIAWLSTSAGWEFPAAFAFLVGAHLVGIGTVLLSPALFRTLVLMAAAAALLLALYAFVATSLHPAIVVVWALLGQLFLAGFLLAVTRDFGHGLPRSGLRSLTAASGFGFILLALLLFTYYAAYDIYLPFPNTLLPLLAMLLVFLAGLGPLLRITRQETMPLLPQARLLAPALLVLILPGLVAVGWERVAPEVPAGYPVRVMTYNLHNGFDARGHLGLEALARAIEAQDPDVVGLQEVSRGWVINGSVDMLAWLSQRLSMPYVYGPTADPQWGNAVLSRLPILDQALVPLPTADLLLRRGFIFTRLDAGNGQTVGFINTHYHHPADGSEIRVLQTEAILDFWQDTPGTVLVGDQNAEHGDPEIDRLLEAGWLDALDLAGVSPGYTNPVPNPTRRIDYVWITADFEVKNAVVVPDAASDHLGIALDLAPRALD